MEVLHAKRRKDRLNERALAKDNAQHLHRSSPMQSSKFTRRSFLLTTLTALTVLLLTLPALRASAQDATAATAAPPQERPYVEFIVGDRIDPIRKWGHVSLRVVDATRDFIFDFGRYGRMWGKDAEGDPILRVWEHQYPAHRKYHLSEGGTTRRYRFQSTLERNSAILAHFEEIVRNGKLYTKSKQWIAYYADYKTFHAVEVNCTTVAIEGFMVGFPEYNLHQSRYATARTLGFVLRGLAQNHGRYDSGSDTWSKIWWPLDLKALLEEKYVRTGRAEVLKL